jgi:hypothetical protein
MIMKISLVLGLLFNLTAFAAPNCRINLRPTGIYFNQCPRTMVAQGTDIRISPGPNPFVTVYALCANTEIICVEAEKDLPEEKN